jgi:hypothetical protein
MRWTVDAVAFEGKGSKLSNQRYSANAEYQQTTLATSYSLDLTY